MTHKCCGGDVKTPYCPNCGKPSHVGGIYSLLNHINNQTKSAETILVKRKKRELQNPNREWCKKAVKQAEHVLNKWSGWQKELIKLMDDTAIDTPTKD